MKLVSQRHPFPGFGPILRAPRRLRPRKAYPTVSRLSLRPGPVRWLARVLGLSPWR